MQCVAKRFQPARECGGLKAHWCSLSPNRTWPSEVSFVASDDMDVKLPDDVAKSAHIDLRAWGCGLEDFARVHDLAPQLSLVGRLEVERFGHARAPRNEDDPSITLVVHQEQRAERPVTQPGRVICQARVQIEGNRCHCGIVAASCLWLQQACRVALIRERSVDDPFVD